LHISNFHGKSFLCNSNPRHMTTKQCTVC
jgi:hypothetical protein